MYGVLLHSSYKPLAVGGHENISANVLHVYSAAVLMGCITGLARLFVRLSLAGS